jgi:hypothetical protein
MSSRSIRSRFLLGAPVALSTLVLGCSLHGQARNPTFSDASAPTVLVAPVSCRSAASRGQAGNQLEAQLRLLVKTTIKARQVELDPEQHEVVCAALGKTYGSGVFVIGGSDGTSEWKTSATITAVVQDIAKASGAKSVLLPVTAHATDCQRDQSTIRDAEGHTVASVDHGTQTCAESAGAVLRAYLVSSDGVVLWKSWATVRGDSSDAIERGVTEVFGSVPAKFVEGDAPAKEADKSDDASDEPARPAKASEAGETGSDAIIAAHLGKNAPSECKEMVKRMCGRVSSAPANVRAQLCVSYANAYKAIASMPNGAATCSMQLKASRPPG